MPVNDFHHQDTAAPNAASPPSSGKGGANAVDKRAGKRAARSLFGFYLLVFALLFLLDAGRTVPMLERQSAEWDAPWLREAAGVVQTVSEMTGLAALTRGESGVLTALTPETLLGARSATEDAGSGESVTASGGEGQRSAPAAPEEDPGGKVEGKAAGKAAVEAALAEFRAGDAPAHKAEPALSGPGGAVAPSGESAFPGEGGTVVTPGEHSGDQIAGPSDAQATESGPLAAEEGRKPKVLLIGDSMMMEGFGPVLQRALRARPDLEVIKEGKYSTGLSRIDYFDWATYLNQLVSRDRPDMVVICLGANDPQDIIDEKGKRHIAGGASWASLYRERADKLLQEATAGGARVIWVGLPIMSKEPYSTRVRLLSDLQRQACEAYKDAEKPGQARFVDTLAVLADARGEYTSFATDAKGQGVRLRYKDKVHVTEDGGLRLTEHVLPFVFRDLGLPAQAPRKSAEKKPAQAPAGTPEKTSRQQPEKVPGPAASELPEKKPQGH